MVAGQERQADPGSDISGPAVSSEITPSSPSATGTLSLEQRADILMARKSYADALEYYQRALKESNFKESRIWNKCGIAHQSLHEISAARKAYKEAIRLNKYFPEPYNNIGTTYYLEKRAKKSLKWYRNAIELNASSASFHYNLGTALYEAKRIKEAVVAFQSALRLEPDFFERRSGFGTTVQARTAEPKYFFYMAKVFASLDRPEEAVHYLRRALEDGFKDFDLLDQDPDLKKMAAYPPYVELRTNPPKPL